MNKHGALALMTMMSLLLVSGLSHAADNQQQYVADSKTGCRIVGTTKVVEGGIKELTIRWDGACLDGKADGPGTYQEFAEGVEYWSETYSQQTGVLMRQGKPLSVLEPSQFELTVAECKKDYSRMNRTVHVHVVPGVDVLQAVIVSDLLWRAERFMWEECPSPDITGISVVIFQHDKRVGGWGTHSTTNMATNRESDRAWSTNYGNEALGKARSTAYNIIRVAKQARGERETLQAKQAEIAAKKKQKETADAKAQALADRFKPTTWIPWDSVLPNPFAYEGKVFLVNTRFREMLTADTAVFGSVVDGTIVVAIGVPRTAFVDRKPVVLVGKVIDSDPSKNPPGVVGRVLRMKYLGHEFCTEEECKDFGSVRSR